MIQDSRSSLAVCNRCMLTCLGMPAGSVTKKGQNNRQCKNMRTIQDKMQSTSDCSAKTRQYADKMTDKVQ